MKIWACMKRAAVWGPVLIFVWAGCAKGLADTSELAITPERFWPPGGKMLRLPLTRDTGVSSDPAELDGNNGGSDRLKLKGIREFILADADVSVLKGSVVTGALIHFRCASSDRAPLARIGVSSIATEWVEGTSSRYRTQKGSSCFLQAAHFQRDWAYSGSTLMDAVFGRGNTIWKFSDCTPPDANGWQSCAVDPDVIASRMAGLSAGFCISDEVGHVWAIKNDRFEYTYFPNRMVYSRESGASAPYFEIWNDGTDNEPPLPITSIHVETENLPPGEAVVVWKTPEDRGISKTLGFFVHYRKDGPELQVPRYLIPMAGRPGNEVRMHLRDLSLEPGETIILTIQPVDAAGNVGVEFTQKIQVALRAQPLDLPGDEIKPFPVDPNLPMAGPLKVSVVDMLDKIDPVSGRMIPEQPEGYKGGNHLFSAQQRLVRLQAARNETVCFQLNLEGYAEDIRVEYAFERHSRLLPKLHQFAYVGTTDKTGSLPDPLVPMSGPISIPSRVGEVLPRKQSNLSLIGELYVPHDEPAGVKQGRITVAAGGKFLALNVELRVWDFTLPNKLSFVPEMNAYGVVSPDTGYDYYRLAHEHRTCINRLSCGWNGIPDFAPGWDGKVFDWENWDRYAAPLLDGSAFRGLPRSGEPVDVFYLPFSENWPVSLYDHFRPSYWADDAFNLKYSEKLKASIALFARHLRDKGWKETVFQFYLNNKVYYRNKTANSSAPWVFDEPIHPQDFWALRWYGILWRQAVKPFRQDVHTWFRSDISYTEFGRNFLWGITDIEYLGHSTAQKIRMKQDESILGIKAYFAEYGTANRVEDSNVQPTFWCLSAWSKGAVGVLPWQTIGSENSWRKGEQAALFYPHKDGPLPSIRLKAFTRGQQDVEYLELYRLTCKKTRRAVSEWVKGYLNLHGHYYKMREDDAGTLVPQGALPEQLWEFRCRIGNAISAKSPEYRRRLLNLESPKWEPDKLPQIGYVNVAPKVENYKPACNDFRPLN